MLILLKLIPLAVPLILSTPAHATLVIDPSAGREVDRLDCIYALRQLWLTRASNVHDAYREESFHLYSFRNAARLPQRFNYRSCSIGVYLTAVLDLPVKANWFAIFLGAELVILECQKSLQPGCSGLYRHAGLDIVVGDPTVKSVTASSKNHEMPPSPLATIEPEFDFGGEGEALLIQRLGLNDTICSKLKPELEKVRAGSIPNSLSAVDIVG
ncbi:hypothetical protein MMC34_005621 [Xylographa carneopallida]|nr:hypothetical protein [Xylographa carneopallida]